MIDGTDFLIATAQISMAFVGFSAVVVTFRESAGQEFAAFQQLQIRVLIELGFGSLFLCGVPLVLSYCGMSDSTVWRLSHGVLGVFLLAYFVNYHLRRRSHARASEDTMRPLWFQFRIYVTYLLGLIALLSALGLQLLPGLALYALGLAWILGVAAFSFVVMITMWTRTGR